MSNFRHFKEYLAANGKLQEKPEIDPKGDTAPEPDKAPEKAVAKGKNWDAKAALSEKPANYAPSTEPWKPKKGEKGFADEGDKKLVYEPEDAKEKKLDSWPKATTEEFIASTQGMTLAEFVTYMSAKNNGGKAHEYIRYVSELLVKNPHLMETFVREVRRGGGISSLVAETLKIPEVVKSIKEMTDSPAKDTEVTKKDLEPSGKKKTKSIGGEPMNMGNSDVVTTKSMKSK